MGGTDLASNPVLPKLKKTMVGPNGLEPSTSSVSRKRSNQTELRAYNFPTAAASDVAGVGAGNVDDFIMRPWAGTLLSRCQVVESSGCADCCNWRNFSTAHPLCCFT